MDGRKLLQKKRKSAYSIAECAAKYSLSEAKDKVSFVHQ
jgi:hypothetical protein